MAFSFSMSLKLLLVTMVASNIISLYHLSSTIIFSSNPPPQCFPDHLLRQLHSIRATINQHTRLQQTSADTNTVSSSAAAKNHTACSHHDVMNGLANNEDSRAQVAIGPKESNGSNVITAPLPRRSNRKRRTIWKVRENAA